MIALLVRGRSNVRHGPFWLGNKRGLVANLVLLSWTLFIIVVYSFPTTMPAAPGSMNYVSALYLALLVAMLLDWWVRARWEFRGHLVGNGNGRGKWKGEEEVKVLEERVGARASGGLDCATSTAGGGDCGGERQGVVMVGVGVGVGGGGGGGISNEATDDPLFRS